MIKIEVVSEEKRWSKKIRKAEFFFNCVCRSFPKKYRFLNRRLSLTLLLSNNQSIKRLNKKFRNKNKHTDILSFPFSGKTMHNKENYLGDIIISFDYINKPKDLSNIKFKKKVVMIFIHGFLHLLGFDHIKKKEYKKMINEENKIFKSVQKFIN